jgi:hypothetical protein
VADAKLRYVGRSKLAFVSSGTPAAANFAINPNTTANGGVAFIVQAETTSAITTIGFRVGARTGTSTGPTYTVGIEGVSTSTGFPDGTYKQTGGIDCKATYTPPNDSSHDGTWQTITLTASYSPTNHGERLALTIRADAGVTSAQYISCTTNVTLLGWLAGNAPNAGRLTTGTWSTTYSGSGDPPVFGYGTAARQFGYPYLSNYAGATAATVGRRIAAVINLPADSFPSYKIRGFTWVGNMATAGGKNPIAGLWSAGGVLQNFTLDSDIGRAPVSALRQSMFTFDESSLSTLSGGTDYYIGLEVADAASSAITLNGVQYHSSTQADADNGGNGIVGVATYDGSNWSASDYSVRPYVEVVIDDVTATAGTSGGIVIGG